MVVCAGVGLGGGGGGVGGGGWSGGGRVVCGGGLGGGGGGGGPTPPPSHQAPHEKELSNRQPARFDPLLVSFAEQSHSSCHPSRIRAGDKGPKVKQEGLSILPPLRKPNS